MRTLLVVRDTTVYLNGMCNEMKLITMHVYSFQWFKSQTNVKNILPKI